MLIVALRFKAEILLSHGSFMPSGQFPDPQTNIGMEDTGNMEQIGFIDLLPMDSCSRFFPPKPGAQQIRYPGIMNLPICIQSI
jgi:hypothetical protein